MYIGTRVRSIRIQQRRTLDDLARACGCSKSLLSKIETGKVIPAVATLSKIASALGVRVSALLEDGQGTAPVFTSNMIGKPDAFVATSKGYAIYAVAPHFTNKKMQPVLVYERKGQVKSHSVAHEGEEYILILEGQVKAHIGKTEYHLKTGESIYFSAASEHGFMPLTEHVVYLDVFVG